MDFILLKKIEFVFFLFYDSKNKKITAIPDSDCLPLQKDEDYTNLEPLVFNKIEIMGMTEKEISPSQIIYEIEKTNPASDDPSGDAFKLIKALIPHAKIFLMASRQNLKL